MRPFALAAAASLAVAALACGGGETASTPAPVTGPQVFFVQIDT